MDDTRTQSKEIADYTFNVSKLPAMRALKLGSRMLRVLGPGLAKALGSAASGVSDFRSLQAAKVDLEKVAAGFGDLFGALKEEEVEHITWELLAITTVTGKGKVSPLNRALFDEIFAGRMADVLKLLRFAFEVQFGNFYEGLLGVVRQYQQASPHSSPDSSPALQIVGQPGASG